LNIFEYIGMILQGPVPQNPYYGQWMLLANYLILYRHTPGSKYSLLFIALGLCLCNILLNLYQVFTGQSLTGNPLIEDIESDLANHIMSRGKEHGVIVANKKIVTNFPTINAFCNRLRHNAEIIISHHWFESEEGKKHLRCILEHEFGHAVYNHMLKRALVNSASYIVTTIAMFSLYAHVILMLDYGYYLVIGLGFIATTIMSYAQAAYNRHTEFEADAFGAHATTPQEMQDALLFLESKNPYDTMTTNIPEWKQGAHPKMFNRIARLELLKRDRH